MTTLQTKIDFAFVIRVQHANPNGDPLNGNRPRTDYGGHGEITDVCLKRKLRDRLQEAGHAIFVQSDDRKVDEETSLRNRAESAKNEVARAPIAPPVVRPMWQTTTSAPALVMSRACSASNT